MSYEETGMPDNETVEPRASRWGTGRIDAVSAVIGGCSSLSPSWRWPTGSGPTSIRCW